MLALARLPQAETDRAPHTALGQRLADVLASPGAWRTGMAGLSGLDWPAVLGLVSDHDAPAGAVLGLAGRAERALLAALSLDRRTSDHKRSPRARWDAARRADPVAGDPAAYEWIDDDGNLIAAPSLETLH